MFLDPQSERSIRTVSTLEGDRFPGMETGRCTYERSKNSEYSESISSSVRFYLCGPGDDHNGISNSSYSLYSVHSFDFCKQFILDVL